MLTEHAQFREIIASFEQKMSIYAFKYEIVQYKNELKTLLKNEVFEQYQNK